MIELRYDFECDVDECDSTYFEKYHFRHGEILPIPCLPPSWLEIRGSLICNKHRVTIEIDQTAHRGKQWRLA